MESLNTPGFSFDLPKGNSSIIKVIGVGGGGNNALKHMYEKGIHGVDFVICNTDSQTLDNNPVANKVQLGVSITEGLGAGADPEVGEKAAIESIEDIKAALGQNTKMVFITAGMGGGTGTGAAPVIAKIARDMGILTVGIVTIPFSFEGRRRLDQADLGLDKLRNNVDSLIVINNDKLRQQFGNLGFKQGFSKADEVLTNAAKGMAEVITGYFDVNIDFRDAKSVLANSGTALMSTGTASGENKAEEAVRKALDSPLLNDNKITGAKNVLLLIRSGSEEATMDEIGLINDHIQREAGNTADIIFGVGTDEELGDAISVLVIATGFAKDDRKHAGPTEKIKIALNDTEGKIQRESPFKSRTERQEQNREELGGKNLFRLDDEDDVLQGPQFRSSLSESKILEEERPTQVTFFGKEDDYQEKNIQFGRDDEEEQEIDLFTYTDNADDLEAESFTFETEEPVKKQTFDERPIEFSFFVNDSEKDTTPIYRTEATEQPNPRPSENKPLQNFTQNPVPTGEIKEKSPEEPQEANEFKFFNKTATSHDAKVQERRNKLKEFNSRYQALEDTSDFETIPAFKRKNIAIEGHNASEQNIGSYLSENERGQMQIRENRFLNKDVD